MSMLNLLLLLSVTFYWFLFIVAEIYELENWFGIGDAQAEKRH